MNDPMERVLSSLERARRHLDHPESQRDVHTIVHDLMHDLLSEMGSLRNPLEGNISRPDQTAGLDRLYDLIEGLTDTCFTLTESRLDDATMALRKRIDRAVKEHRTTPGLH